MFLGFIHAVAWISTSFLFVRWPLSRVRLFATPGTVTRQPPLSMGFSRQEYWSRLPFLSPEDLPDLGIEPGSPALQADSLPSEPPGKISFLWLKGIPYMGRPQLVDIWVVSDLGLLWLVAQWTFMDRLFAWTPLFDSFGYMLRSGLAEPCDHSVSVLFVRDHQIVFHSHTILHPTSSSKRLQMHHVFANTFIFWLFICIFFCSRSQLWHEGSFHCGMHDL